MGSSDSANYEWIELYNDSANSVDISDWELADGMKLSIALSGTIAANSYAVLERNRSDGGTVGTVLMNYTRALVNTGATITLKHADGSLEDQVAGGKGWENIGGDNVTKETAQYTVSGWITAPATPGKQNATTGTVPEPEEEMETKDSSSSNTSPSPRVSSISTSEPIKLVLPDVTLKLDIDAQTVGYVNQSIDFAVDASDIGDTLVDSLVYEWNFGDGYTTSKKEVSHVYEYPGTYVVTVYGLFKRQEQAARHEITILPVTISLTRNNEGDMQVNNDSPYEIDISGYSLKASEEFIFPARSILLPNQTVTIYRKKLGFGNLTVFDATGSMVVEEGGEKVTQVPVQVNRIVSVPAPATIPADISSFSFATSTPETMIATTTTETQSNNQSAAIIKTGTTIPPNTLPYLGLIGVLAVGTLGVFAKPNRNQID